MTRPIMTHLSARKCAVVQTNATTVVIDDDESVRKAASATDPFGRVDRDNPRVCRGVSCHRRPPPACLILDIGLPGMSGLDLQQLLATTGRDIAIVVITAREDQTARLTAVGAGAVDFIAKSFARERLLDAIAKPMARSA